MAAGVLMLSVSTQAFSAATILSMARPMPRPWTDRKMASSQGSLMRAKAYCILVTLAKISSRSLGRLRSRKRPTPKKLGSPEASTTACWSVVFEQLQQFRRLRQHHLFALNIGKAVQMPLAADQQAGRGDDLQRLGAETFLALDACPDQIDGVVCHVCPPCGLKPLWSAV